MRSDAFILVTCDGCGGEIEIQLVATARGGYDDRNVDGELADQGWSTSGNMDFCDECTNEQNVANASVR